MGWCVGRRGTDGACTLTVNRAGASQDLARLFVMRPTPEDFDRNERPQREDSRCATCESRAIQVKKRKAEMAAAIDFKNPAIVIVGHWNSAILNEPGWIAKHLLDVPDGQQIDLQAIVVGNQIGPSHVAPEKQIWLFDQYGICCTGQRLEIYTRDIDNLEPLYLALSKIALKLPHTPIRAIGINFNVKVNGEFAAITSLLETKESFDLLGAIRTVERTDSIEIGNENLIEIDGVGRVQTTLNLARKSDFNQVEINFNYHSLVQGIEIVDGFVGGNPISHWREHATTILRDCYDLAEVTAEYF